MESYCSNQRRCPNPHDISIDVQFNVTVWQHHHDRYMHLLTHLQFERHLVCFVSLSELQEVSFFVDQHLDWYRVLQFKSQLFIVILFVSVGKDQFAAVNSPKSMTTVLVVLNRVVIESYHVETADSYCNARVAY